MEDAWFLEASESKRKEKRARPGSPGDCPQRREGDESPHLPRADWARGQAEVGDAENEGNAPS